MPSKHTDNGFVLLRDGEWRHSQESTCCAMLGEESYHLRQCTEGRQAFWCAVIPVLGRIPIIFLPAALLQISKSKENERLSQNTRTDLRISMHRWDLYSSLYVFMCVCINKYTWAYIYTHHNKAWMKVMVDLHNYLTLSPWCLWDPSQEPTPLFILMPLLLT